MRGLDGNMADDVNQCVENALTLLLSVNEKSSNLRKDLKNDISSAVSEIRKSICKFKSDLEEKNKEIHDLEVRLRKTEERHRQTKNERATTVTKQLPPPIGEGRNYAAALSNDRPAADTEKKKYKLFIKSKHNESPDAIKTILKRKINPTELKVGISTFKSLRDGRLVIETECRKEIDVLSEKIREQCSQHLEVNAANLRKPNVIIHNIPEDVTIENASAIILSQNSELHLKEDTIQPKYIFKNKSNTKNLIAEVSTETWRVIVERKIKMGWQLCYVNDYIKVNRCFKCSKFNHKAADCKGELTCPLCTGDHKLNECKADGKDFKCINCMNFNKHNRNENVCENHSSTDKNCPSLQMRIRKYRQNTDY